MATTTANSLQGDVLAYLAEEVLPLSQKTLVVHQFGVKHRIPKGRGLTMIFTRYNRLPLPFGPLSEGVPAVSNQLSIQQVIGVAQQWGGQVTITDVAEMTIFHDPFQQAKRLVGYQVAETLERNDFLTLLGGTQVNFVNSRGSRGSLQAGDVLDPFTVQRTQIALSQGGAPMFAGPEGVDVKKDIAKLYRGNQNPASQPHFVAVGSYIPIGDLRQNPTISNAWSFSEVESLYNSEAGQWSSIRFCQSNMVPSFTGVAQVNGANATGSLATGTYFIQVTGSDTQNQYESRIYQVSAGVSVTTGGISVTLPNIAGFTFSVYVGTTSSPTNLGLSTSGPTSGPFTGQATQLAANTTVTITGTGLAQTPPAAPNTGVTVYPVFIFGEGAFGVVELENTEFFYLANAEKADPQNQLRVVAWKTTVGGMLLNTSFMARIECTSAFSATYG
jgi:N4-gp56 family major capsid protein